MQMEVRVRSITWEAPGVHSYELVPLTGELPDFEAGAHIEVKLPAGLARQYSLHNAPGERHRYLISVSLQPQGRGGSRAIHEQVRVGQVLAISAPRNAFDGPFVLRAFAGGTGRANAASSLDPAPDAALAERIPRIEACYAALFEHNGFEGVRRVIEISGDGYNNRGRPVEDARDEAVATGIRINGLPIVNDRPNPWGGRPPSYLGVAILSAALIGLFLSLLIARELGR